MERFQDGQFEIISVPLTCPKCDSGLESLRDARTSTFAVKAPTTIQCKSDECDFYETAQEMKTRLFDF